MELNKEEIRSIISQRVFRRYQWWFYGVLGGLGALVLGLTKALHPETIRELLPIAIPLGIVFIAFMVWWFGKCEKETKAAIKEFQTNPTVTYVTEVAKDVQGG